ncbi:protein of unknown function [Mameliella alba]|uniref:DUF4166 domain-containing protein n=1 Tax=Mameliella alba TaxID=561184 RepID=UPI000891114F|nr:uncharacterized protein DUF4166 [Mameliella alba]GGF83597.1 hypothetical protein GCM10011319_49490 [Mameliella alba]SDE22608.1 protein of unknown function [Mameliella alba]
MTPYAQVLGADLDRLPTPCQALHRAFGRFEGRITVEPGPFLVLRMLARLMGLPAATPDAPLVLETAPTEKGACWTRRIGPQCMMSQQRAMPDGTLAEQLGPVTLAARLVPDGAGLRLETAWVRFLGLRLPRFFWPGMQAREWAESGLYRFEIDIRLPVLGTRLIAYSGWLDPLAS